MTENFYKKRIYKTDHTKFGGIIYPFDFNTNYRDKSNTNGSQIASRIAVDKRFDEQCRKNIELRKLKEENNNEQFKKNGLHS